MKRLLFILYVLLPAAFLSGCGASLAADRHDVERLLLIQTMGLDSRGDGVEMSVSTGLGAEDAPALVMSAPASGIEDAIARLQNYSPENQLFYAHVQYLLLGEEAARRELGHVIEWVDRSPTLRMDTNMLVVRGSARDAVVDTSEQSTDITQRLESMDRQARSTGWTVYTLREIAAALAEGNGALCLTIDTAPTDGNVFTEEMGSDAVVPVGYAMLGQEGLVDFLSPEESLGAEIITGDPTGLLITVAGSTLEILDCSVSFAPRFAPDGQPSGAHIRCTLQAGMLEKARDGAMNPEEMDAALSRTVSRWVSDALARSQAAGCDCLGIRDAVLTSSRDMALWEERWPELFPGLSLSAAVEGQVDRSYDLAQ